MGASTWQYDDYMNHIIDDGHANPKGLTLLFLDHRLTAGPTDARLTYALGIQIS
jgi:hypothetical protein